VETQTNLHNLQHLSAMASRMFSRSLQRNFRNWKAYSTKSAQSQTIGIIGLGTVGEKVASNLLKAGFTVSALHDCDPKAGERLPGNIPRTKSPRELAEICNVVMTALPAPPHVRDVMTGDSGVLAGLRPGGVWIDHSTTDYQQTLELAEAAGRFRR
jgi:3-hydroxyisobutyrate dehydrogenase-like beta-hydroxyacid dehydrogenase